ncbi:hypothetical protein JM946_29445 [Steroidobacter sp. S1-65]|uniref:Uncharacterized protein n=1 Tax=Steroidobacter gossypii TaxID=2805490 RepID=A0ABS1X6M5_9GAMM|nr:hypothetical protein [Steroidobacter gossypii]MBM0108876.1 hypothetical protein [Steroidobacter gossypii]
MDRDRRKQGSSQHERALPSREARRLAGAGSLIVGRLQSHGTAPYQFRRGEEMSYYVDLTVLGNQKRLWGKDLKRALEQAETKPQPGDVVGVQLVSRRAFTVTHRERDKTGRVISQTDREAHRNEWKIEKVQYFSERARAARLARDDQRDRARALAQRPELKSTFLTLRAAQALAEQRLPNAADREQFLKLVKEAIHQSTLTRESLRESGPRERSIKTPAPVHPRKREDPVR